MSKSRSYSLERKLEVIRVKKAGASIKEIQKVLDILFLFLF